MRPSIRDESGLPVFGVAPVPILIWVMKCWKQEDKASIGDFVLVSNEIDTTRAIASIVASGGTRFGLESSDSQTFRVPDENLVCIIDIHRDYTRAQAEFRVSRQRRVGACYYHLKYWVNLHRVITREANKALSSAKLLAAHRDSRVSSDELWYRVRELQEEAERRFLRRIVTSRVFPASVMVVLFSLFLRDGFPLTFHGMERFEGANDKNPPQGDAIMPDGKGNSPEPLPDFEKVTYIGQETDPKSAGARNGPTKIRDESGAHVAGVDPAPIVKWALSAFQSDDARELREIIVVNDESAIENIELELMLRGAYPIHKRSPKSRTYALENSGAVLIMNIGRLQYRVIARLKKPERSWINRRYVSFLYRTRLKHDTLYELRLGVASAKLAVLQRAGTLPDSEVDQKYADLYCHCWGPVLMRTWRSALIPSVLFLVIVELACRQWRRSREVERI